MPSSKKTEYTLEDIYALPDGQRAELISGQALHDGSAEYTTSETC